MSRFRVTDAAREQILALADAGHSAVVIADEIGCHELTIWRVAKGRLKAKPGPKPMDRARMRRLVEANRVAERGQRNEIARRFGLKDRHSLAGSAWYARKVLAAEARA